MPFIFSFYFPSHFPEIKKSHLLAKYDLTGTANLAVGDDSAGTNIGTSIAGSFTVFVDVGSFEFVSAVSF